MKTEISPSERTIQELRELLEERGKKALESARKTVRTERDKISCKKIKEALEYFIEECWHDTARPAFLSIACEAVGGKRESTDSVAVPLILISGGIDIHDDIIDESHEKYGKKTIYGKYGKNIALLLGDLLLFKGLTLLSVNSVLPKEKQSLIINIVKDTFFELGDAESLELGFRGENIPRPEHYLKVVEKKAADVEAHTKIAAIIGNGNKDEIATMARLGRLLGMLIVLRDDVLDVLDPKELTHRFSKEHLPLPLLYVCQKHEAWTQLREVLDRPRMNRRDHQTVVRMISKEGGFDASQKVMTNIAKEALSHVEGMTKRKEFTLLINFLAYDAFSETKKAALASPPES
jgi:geranylgeranyl pyrophosphate synthase